MPRRTVEDVAGEAFRASQRKPPSPPSDLNPRAAAVWRKITGARPADWFDEGSLPLLRRLCRSIISAEKLHDAYDAQDPASDPAAALLKQVVSLNHSIATLSVKLRLSIQTGMDWHDSQRTKRGLSQHRLLKGVTTWGAADLRDGADLLAGGFSRYPGSKPSRRQ